STSVGAEIAAVSPIASIRCQRVIGPCSSFSVDRSVRQDLTTARGRPGLAGRWNDLGDEPDLERGQPVLRTPGELVVIQQKIAESAEIDAETRLGDAAVEVAPDLVHAKTALRLKVVVGLLAGQRVEAATVHGAAFDDDL